MSNRDAVYLCPIAQDSASTDRDCVWLLLDGEWYCSKIGFDKFQADQEEREAELNLLSTDPYLIKNPFTGSPIDESQIVIIDPHTLDGEEKMKFEDQVFVAYEGFEDETITCAAFDEIHEHVEKLDELKWNLPQVVVIGSESCGKSTILQRLMGVPVLPRASKFCTLVPIRIRMRRTKTHEVPILSYRIKSAVVMENNTKIVSDPECQDKTPVPMTKLCEKVDELSNRLLGMENDERKSDEQKVVVVDYEIVVEINGPTFVNIDYVDLPGLRVYDADRKRVKDDAWDLVKRYIELYEKQSIFLLVADINKIGTQQALKLLERLEDRSIGVLTKSDKFVSDDPFNDYHNLKVVEQFQKIFRGNINGKSTRLGYGWVLTMNSISTCHMEYNADEGFVCDNYPISADTTNKITHMDDMEHDYLQKMLGPGNYGEGGYLETLLNVDPNWEHEYENIGRLINSLDPSNQPDVGLMDGETTSEWSDWFGMRALRRGVQRMYYAHLTQKWAHYVLNDILRKIHLNRVIQDKSLGLPSASNPFNHLNLMPEALDEIQIIIQESDTLGEEIVNWRNSCFSKLKTRFNEYFKDLSGPLHFENHQKILKIQKRSVNALNEFSKNLKNNFVELFGASFKALVREKGWSDDKPFKLFRFQTLVENVLKRIENVLISNYMVNFTSTFNMLRDELWQNSFFKYHEVTKEDGSIVVTFSDDWMALIRNLETLFCETITSPLIKELRDGEDYRIWETIRGSCEARINYEQAVWVKIKEDLRKEDEEEYKNFDLPEKYWLLWERYNGSETPLMMESFLAPDLPDDPLFKSEISDNHPRLKLEKKIYEILKAYQVVENMMRDYLPDKDNNWDNKVFKVQNKFDAIDLLRILYDSLNGDEWNRNTNWMRVLSSNGAIDVLEGVEVDPLDDNIPISIDLSNNNCVGTLPEEIKNWYGLNLILHGNESLEIEDTKLDLHDLDMGNRKESKEENEDDMRFEGEITSDTYLISNYEMASCLSLGMKLKNHFPSCNINWENGTPLKEWNGVTYYGNHIRSIVLNGAGTSKMYESTPHFVTNLVGMPKLSHLAIYHGDETTEGDLFQKIV